MAEKAVAIGGDKTDQRRGHSGKILIKGRTLRRTGRGNFKDVQRAVGLHRAGGARAAEEAEGEVLARLFAASQEVKLAGKKPDVEAGEIFRRLRQLIHLELAELRHERGGKGRHGNIALLRITGDPHVAPPAQPGLTEIAVALRECQRTTDIKIQEEVLFASGRAGPRLLIAEDGAHFFSIAEVGRYDAMNLFARDSIHNLMDLDVVAFGQRYRNRELTIRIGLSSIHIRMMVMLMSLDQHDRSQSLSLPRNIVVLIVQRFMKPGSAWLIGALRRGGLRIGYLSCLRLGCRVRRLWLSGRRRCVCRLRLDTGRRLLGI